VASAKGQVVLFLRGDRPELGVHDGERVVTADGKRLRIARTAVLAVGPSAGPRAPRETARAWGRDIERAAAQVDVAELWELLRDEGELAPGEVVEAWFGGEPPFEQRAALLFALLSDTVYFSRRRDVLVAEPAARVEERLARARDHRRKERRIDALAAVVRAGMRPEAAGQDVDEADWRRFVEGLTTLAVHGPEHGRPEDLEVLRRAGVPSGSGPFELLVRAGVFAPDENLELRLHGVRRELAPEVEQEAAEIARAVADPGRWSGGRPLVTGGVTVDSERTVEVDDALTVRPLEEGWELGVHIADVSCLVHPGTATWREAVERGATLYTPDLIIPMLPHCLGAGGFSLDPDVERPAMSLFATVRRDGTVTDHRFERTRLRVERRLDYASADALAAAGDPVLAPLVEAGRALQEARARGGAVQLRLPELDVRIDRAGEIHVSVSREVTPSHVLVSECAILKNTLAGRLVHESGLAGIYRSQPEPADELPDTVEGGPAAELAARRALPPSKTSTVPGKHFMLGVDVYSMVTSPIRRSFDLVMQHQLGCLVDGAPERALDRAAIDAILLFALPAAAALASIERSRKRYWLLEHLSQKVTSTLLPAVVVDLMQDRVLLHLPEYALEVPLRTRDPGRFRRGELVEVRLDRADARRDIVRVSLV
jgi:exoribonuclease-2